MSKKYSETEHLIDYTEDNNFSKNEYTHADQSIIEDRYTKPKKRRHTFTEFAKKYRKAKYVAKSRK